MILKTEDYKDFLRAHLGFLHYCYCINNKGFIAFNKFLDLPFTDKIKSRDYFLQHDNLLEDYFEDKKALPEREIEILNGYKKRITGDFVILKQLKKHAIFIDSNYQNIYGVVALGDTFDTFFDYFPVLVKATLIPFRDIIIYDGLISSYSVRIGKNIFEELDYKYKNAKSHNKVITGLTDK